MPVVVTVATALSDSGGTGRRESKSYLRIDDDDDDHWHRARVVLHAGARSYSSYTLRYCCRYDEVLCLPGGNRRAVRTLCR